MIEQLEAYASHLNANDEIKSWLRTTGKKALKSEVITISELEHIIDFLVSSQAPHRLQKMSIKDANILAKKWSEQNQKKGRDLKDSDEDIEVIHRFDDGNSIVKLKTKKSFQREGFLMSHCLGGYNPDNENCDIYSYRDKNNMPHATFEVAKSQDQIIQIKGRGNGTIHPKYIQPILTFLKLLKMDVSPKEMKNLGYYHIDPSHIEFLKKYPRAEKQIAIVNGESYAF